MTVALPPATRGAEGPDVVHDQNPRRANGNQQRQGTDNDNPHRLVRTAIHLVFPGPFLGRVIHGERPKCSEKKGPSDRSVYRAGAGIVRKTGLDLPGIAVNSGGGVGLGAAVAGPPTAFLRSWGPEVSTWIGRDKDVACWRL